MLPQENFEIYNAFETTHTNHFFTLYNRYSISVILGNFFRGKCQPWGGGGGREHIGCAPFL